MTKIWYNTRQTQEGLNGGKMGIYSPSFMANLNTAERSGKSYLMNYELFPFFVQSMSFQKTLIMQNEPNLNIILTYLTKEMKRTYSDFYQKEAKKTNPILTFS